MSSYQSWRLTARGPTTRIALALSLIVAAGAADAHVVFQKICVAGKVEAKTPDDPSSVATRGSALKSAWKAWEDDTVTKWGADFRMWHHANDTKISCTTHPNAAGGQDNVCDVSAIPCKAWTED